VEILPQNLVLIFCSLLDFNVGSESTATITAVFRRYGGLKSPGFYFLLYFSNLVSNESHLKVKILSIIATTKYLTLFTEF